MSATNGMNGNGVDLAVAIAEVRAAAEFLHSPYFVGELIAAAHRAGIHAQSPWMDRATAAAYCHCGLTTIDAAVRDGAFARYMRAGTPLYRRDEIDAAITEGRWLRRGESTEKDQSPCPSKTK